MRALICGSRDWTKRPPIYVLVAGLKYMLSVTGLYGPGSERDSELVVIQGGARGVDAIARDAARVFDVECLPFPAAWDDYPPHLRWKAGHDRNQRMLDEGDPDVVFAYKDGFDWQLRKGGTEDMVRRAYDAGVPVYVTSRYRGPA